MVVLPAMTMWMMLLLDPRLLHQGLTRLIVLHRPLEPGQAVPA